MPGGELQTEPILRQAFAQGKRVACPIVMDETNGWMEMFEVGGADEALQLPKSKWRLFKFSAHSAMPTSGRFLLFSLPRTHLERLIRV